MVSWSRDRGPEMRTSAARLHAHFTCRTTPLGLGLRARTVDTGRSCGLVRSGTVVQYGPGLFGGGGRWAMGGGRWTTDDPGGTRTIRTVSPVGARPPSAHGLLQRLYTGPNRDEAVTS